jgi:hypothetical protein
VLCGYVVHLAVDDRCKDDEWWEKKLSLGAHVAYHTLCAALFLF